jgi:chorismate mutase
MLKRINGNIRIAGPCSAESEEQLMKTVEAITRHTELSAIRAGVWKPRTRPGSFEGRGSVAFEWLKKVKDKFQIPIAVEVGNAWHVEEALNHGVDIVWLGARTTVNPFYVQEIANALRGASIPVMVKNPLHPDLGLWMGSIERIQSANVGEVVAIHRGFYNYETAPYRNEPKWEVAIDLKRQAPELHIICDPSHIAGNRKLVAEVAQTALDLQMDGLMIETHYQPENALSDADQQLTPAQLNDLFDNLIYRTPSSENALFQTALHDLRLEIDQIDTELLEIIARRKRIVEEIGHYKKDNNVTIFQIERWLEILRSRRENGAEIGLNENLVMEIFSLLHKYSIRLQNHIMHHSTESKKS